MLRLPPTMKLGVPKETAAGETRVAVVPDTVRRLAEQGVETLVEHGAGEQAAFPDSAYEEAGGQLVAAEELYAETDVVCKVQKPSAEEIGRLRSGQTLIAPEVAEQSAIASTLGALDDKIDLNQRTSETLEAMARAFFKDWFVDFGPTRAKMENRAPYLAPELQLLYKSKQLRPKDDADACVVIPALEPERAARLHSMLPLGHPWHAGFAD